MSTRPFADTCDVPSPREDDQCFAKRLAVEPVEPGKISSPPPIVPQYGMPRIEKINPSELYDMHKSRATYLSMLPVHLFQAYLIDRYLDPCAFSVKGFEIEQTQIDFSASAFHTCGPTGHGWTNRTMRAHTVAAASGDVVVLFIIMLFSANSIWIGVLDRTPKLIWERIFKGLPPMRKRLTHVDCISKLGEDMSFTFALWYNAIADPAESVFAHQTAMIFAYNDGTISREPFLFDRHGRTSITTKGAVLSIPHHPELRPSWLSPTLGRIDLDEYRERKDISNPAYRFDESPADGSWPHENHAVICDKLLDEQMLAEMLKNICRPDDAELLSISRNGTYAVCRPFAGGVDVRVPLLSVYPINHRPKELVIELPSAPISRSDCSINILIATDWGFAYQINTKTPASQKIFLARFVKPECVGN